MNVHRTYTFLAPFCGLGAGALGFLRANAHLLGRDVRFECLGGIDLDADACADFERLTGTPSLCADISKLTPADLRAFAGDRAPDVVFGSPPCKGASGLLAEKKSHEPKYVALNRLALVWIELMLATWAEPPRLVLMENVPGITRRAAEMLRDVRRRLRAAGYVLHEGTHDCGEIGGLAQHRKRWLLVARRPASVPALLYQPIKRRVRGVGEVLGELPMPGDPAAGPLHRLPRVSWLTWVRLALIPAGGDWRDLPASVALPCVAAKGANAYSNVYRVIRWDDPSASVIGATRPGSGALSIADPRVHDPARHSREHNDHVYGVLPWSDPAHAIAGKSSAGNGPFSVQDPRLQNRDAAKLNFPAFGVISSGSSAPTITGEPSPSNGRFSFADPRVSCEPWNGSYGAVSWSDPSGVVTGAASIDNARAAVADPRIPEDWRQPPSDPPPVIIALDGTWHRPMTTLELAVLQGLPATLDGKPLTLTARSESKRREHIGNAVPVGAAEAIARQMLLTLAQADAGTWALSLDGSVWVDHQREAVRQ